MNKRELLTSREQECLKLSAFGFSNIEIGKFLYITENTVKKNLGETFKKLKAKDRANAITISFFNGILNPEILTETLTKYDLSWEYERN